MIENTDRNVMHADQGGGKKKKASTVLILGMCISIGAGGLGGSMLLSKVVPLGTKYYLEEGVQSA